MSEVDGVLHIEREPMLLLIDSDKGLTRVYCIVKSGDCKISTTED